MESLQTIYVIARIVSTYASRMTVCFADPQKDEQDAITQFKRCHRLISSKLIDKGLDNFSISVALAAFEDQTKELAQSENIQYNELAEYSQKLKDIRGKRGV